MDLFKSHPRSTKPSSPIKPNATLAQFGLMLSHPEFHDFFTKNFSTWEDCKHSIMLLKAGMAIKEAVKQRTGHELSGNELVDAIQQVIQNRDSRAFMVDSMMQFIEPRPVLREENVLTLPSNGALGHD